MKNNPSSSRGIMWKHRGDSRRVRLQELDTGLAATTKEDSDAFFQQDDNTCYSSDDNDSDLKDENNEDVNSTYTRTDKHQQRLHYVHRNEAFHRRQRWEMERELLLGRNAHDLHDLPNLNLIDNTNQGVRRRHRRFRWKTPKLVKVIVWASRISRLQWDTCPVDFAFVHG